MIERFRAALRDPPAGRSARPAPQLSWRAWRLPRGHHGRRLPHRGARAFLKPQTQRYLYRRLRALAAAGNQVLYSTHAPAFLNVARLEELVLVRHSPRRGTHVVQPQPLDADEAFRVVSEFDAERSELFLARSAILVEGRTEKLVLRRSSPRSDGTPTAPRFRSSSAAASRTSRCSPASARLPDSVRGRPRPGRACGRAADSRRGRAQPPDRLDRGPRPHDRARAGLRGRHRTSGALQQARAGLGALHRPGVEVPEPLARASPRSRPPAARGAGAGVARRDEKPASRVRDSPMPTERAGGKLAEKEEER